MQSQLLLRQQAIQSAKDANWLEAIQLNQAIVSQNPRDLEALNRLGLAYLKNGQNTEAKKTFLLVLSLDKSNIIANKHLKNIKNNGNTPDIVFSNNIDFIEEPGKSKIVSLHRLTSKNLLSHLKVGQSCQLQIKNRYISVTDEDGHHIGALPEDLSFRLSNLIKTGNIYSCVIYKVCDNQCAVQLKEVERSKRNAQVLSFPAKIQNKLNSLNDDFVLEEDIPFETGLEENDFELGGFGTNSEADEELDSSNNRYEKEDI